MSRGGGTSQTEVPARARGNPSEPIIPSTLRPVVGPECHNLTARSRIALPITLTDDKAMAAAAMIGESRMPKNG
jgi:hypothetical protein